MSKKAIRINDNDNVAVMTEGVLKREEIEVFGTGMKFAALEDIPTGHKVALVDLPKETMVIKYGLPIARINTTGVMKGNWVDEHVVFDITQECCDKYSAEFRSSGDVRPASEDLPNPPYRPDATIDVYMRPDGRFGVRNFVIAIPISPEYNDMAKAIVEETDCIWLSCNPKYVQKGKYDEFTRTGMILTGQHPNIYGSVLLGDRDDPNLNSLANEIGRKGQKVMTVSCSSGTCKNAKAEAKAAVVKLQKEAAAQKRETRPVEGLRVEVHCGGSDWTTALTGNVSLGLAADHIVANGGYMLMTEVDGYSGSEHILAANSVNKEVGLKILDRVDEIRADFLKNTGRRVETVNPYPGNKKGGITTLVEKSTGNIKKAGHTRIMGILSTNEQPTCPGVWLVDHRTLWGNDYSPALAGAHLSMFVTGVGEVYFSNPIMPQCRMTGNPETFANPRYMLDFNAGKVILGQSLEDNGKELYDYLLRVASGEETKLDPYKDHEFALVYPGADDLRGQPGRAKPHADMKA